MMYTRASRMHQSQQLGDEDIAHLLEQDSIKAISQ